MIGLDTNILLRYILQDDPLQSPKVTRLIENTLTRENPGYISLIAIAEVVWALSNSLHFPTERVVWALRQLLLSRTLQVQNELEVFAAASIFETGEGDFADALIGALGLWAGCSHTLTFDRKASRLPGMKLI